MRYLYPGGVHGWQFRIGKKEDVDVGKTKRGKGSKIMATTDAFGIPCAAHVESPSPHEVKLVEATIDSGFIAHAPYRILGDKACDSDGLDIGLLFERGVEMIGPHQGGRRNPKPRAEESSNANDAAGRWKGFFPGSKTLGE